MYACALFLVIISSRLTTISDFPAGPHPNHEPVFINGFFSSIEISSCQSLPCDVDVTGTFNLTRDDLKDIMLSEMISKTVLYQRAEDGSVHTAEGVKVINIHLSEEFGEDLSSVTVQYRKDTPYRDILTLRVRSKELRRSSASDYSPKSEPRIVIHCSAGGELIDCENVKGPFTLITSVYTGLGKPSNVTVLPEPDMRIKLFEPRYDFRNYLWERVQQMDVQLLRPGSHQFKFQVTVDGTKTTKSFSIVADFNLTTTPAPTPDTSTPALPTDNETGPWSTICIVVSVVLTIFLIIICLICSKKKMCCWSSHGQYRIQLSQLSETGSEQQSYSGSVDSVEKSTLDDEDGLEEELSLDDKVAKENQDQDRVCSPDLKLEVESAGPQPPDKEDEDSSEPSKENQDQDRVCSPDLKLEVESAGPQPPDKEDEDSSEPSKSGTVPSVIENEEC